MTSLADATPAIGEAASYAQQRLWFLAQLEPDGVAYNIGQILRLRGALNVRALESALEELVRRHAALRTRFSDVRGLPRQAIDPPPAIRLTVETPDPADATDRAAVHAWVDADLRRPFHLTTGPLLRVRLLRLAAQDHVLLLTLHHIVVDAWSLTILARELMLLYAAYEEGKPSPLAPLPAQYADFVRWQREWLQGEALPQQLAYWRSQLAGLPTLTLPTDLPRPPHTNGRAGRLRCRLGPLLTRRLRALGRENGVTQFMALLAVFGAVLGWYARQERFAVGTATAGRTRPELQPLVGVFINLLPLRIDLSGHPTFRQFLGRIRDTCLGGYAQQAVPFERIVEELAPARVPGRAPLFDVAFGLQNATRRRPTAHALTAETTIRSSERTRYDLTVWATVLDDDLDLLWTYRTDLFAAASIRQLNERLRAALTAVVLNADITLASLYLVLDQVGAPGATREWKRSIPLRAERLR